MHLTPFFSIISKKKKIQFLYQQLLALSVVKNLYSILFLITSHP